MATILEGAHASSKGMLAASCVSTYISSEEHEQIFIRWTSQGCLEIHHAIDAAHFGIDFLAQVLYI